MHLGEGVVQFERLARSLVRQQMSLPNREANAVAGSDVVSIRESGIGKGIGGIGGNRLLKHINTLLEALRGATIPELASFQIQPIGFRVGSAGATQPLLFLAAKADSQSVGDVAGDVALQFRDVGHLASIVRTPKLSAIPRIDQVGLNAQFAAMLRDTSHQNGTHLKLLANLLRELL